MSDGGTDWRRRLLESARLEPESGAPVDPLHWPGYSGRQAVRWGHAQLGKVRVVVAAWDFGVQGGSFGERDATAFLAAVDAAVAEHLPLVSLLRSGGTRLQEGMAALVGMPRATLGIRRLAAAGVLHVAVADQPTTGGVWVTIGSRADIRAAVQGAVVGFAGPRVVEAVTGAQPARDGAGARHTAAAAADAGLVDALLAPDEVRPWLVRTLAALAPAPQPAPPARLGELSRPTEPAEADDSRAAADGWEVAADGWEQVERSRTRPRPSGAELLAALVPGGVPLITADGTVAARVGHLAGRAGQPEPPGQAGSASPAAPEPVIGVAVAAQRGGAPTVAGLSLLTRAARLADKLQLPLVTLVDTPGADPSPAQENAGIAAAIGAAMDAVLACSSPTVAVLHGEGGSGGALAAACTDRVLVTTRAYFAALGPEGAAVTLRRPAPEAMRLMGVRPDDLLGLGFADAVIEPGSEGAAVARVLTDLASVTTDRLAARQRRWSQPLPGHVTDT